MALRPFGAFRGRDWPEALDVVKARPLVAGATIQQSGGRSGVVGAISACEKGPPVGIGQAKVEHEFCFWEGP